MRARRIAAALLVVAPISLGCSRDPAPVPGALPRAAPRASLAAPARGPGAVTAASVLGKRRPFHAITRAFDGGGHGYTTRVHDDGRVELGAPFGDTFTIANRDVGEAPTVDAAGVVHVRHADYDERFDNGDRGLEESWTFARRPAARDVQIRLSTSGLSYLGQGKDGLHFAGAHTRFRYGAATLVEATGRRHDVRLACSASEIALRLPAALLDAVVYPATLDPLVGPEEVLDPSTISPTSFFDARPGIGASSTQAYMAWYDSRRTADGLDLTSFDFYGARIDPQTGKASGSDSAGVPLLRNVSLSDSSSPPAIASAGGDFLAVVNLSGGLVSLRIDGTTGELAADDVGGAPIAEITDVMRPVAAGIGDEYFVAWSNDPVIFTKRIARVGPSPDPIPIELVSDPGSESLFIDCSPTLCVLAWSSTSNGLSHFVRLDPATGKPIAGDASGPASFDAGGGFITSVTYGAGTFLITWENGSVVKGARLDPTTGQPIAADATPHVLLPFDPSDVAVRYDGARYVLSFVDLGAGHLDLETFDGTTLAPAGTGQTVVTGVDVPAGQQQRLANVATVGTTSITVGVSSATSGLLAGTFDDDAHATVVSPSAVLMLPNLEAQPLITSLTNGELLSWVDDRAPRGNVSFSLYAALLGADGKLQTAADGGMAAPEFSVLPTATANVTAVGALSLAPDLPAVMMTWTETTPDGASSEADFGIFNPLSGQLIADSVQQLPGIPNLPALAKDDQHHVAIAAVAGGTAVVTLFDTQDFSAKTMTIQPALGLGPTAFENPSIAYGGKGSFLLVWSVIPLDGSRSFQTAALRVTSDGALYPGDKGVIFSQNAATQVGAHVASADAKYLVVWYDGRDDASQLGVYGRAIAVDAALDSGIDFRLGDRLGASYPTTVAPAVIDAGDGLSFQVAWTHDTALYGSVVSHAGVVRDAAPTLLASGGGEYSHPSLANVPGSPGDMILAYSHEEGGTLRVHTRTLTTGPTSGKCTTADDCATRNCRDGFCCDTTCDGACETCSATPGTCTPVRSTVDPDTCDGASICSASGSCLASRAALCAHDTDCASGFCADGVCCDSACNGGCDVCNATPGTCTVAAKGSSGGNPPCTPYICDGQAHICPSMCATDSDCTRPSICAADKTCKVETGAYCVDDATLKTPTGTLVGCAPYACRASACASPCASIEDCMGGTVCDANGECVAPTAVVSSGGCSVATEDRDDRGAVFGGVMAFVALAISRSRRRRS